MATNLPSCFLIQFLEQLLKFLGNFTLLKYVKSQRSYGFFNHKRADRVFLVLKFWIRFSFCRLLIKYFSSYPNLKLGHFLGHPVYYRIMKGLKCPFLMYIVGASLYLACNGMFSMKYLGFIFQLYSVCRICRIFEHVDVLKFLMQLSFM